MHHQHESGTDRAPTTRHKSTTHTAPAERAAHNGNASAEPRAGRMLQLQRTAGNHAVSGLVGRSAPRRGPDSSPTVQRSGPSRADASRARAVETRAERVAHSASTRGADISAVSDACIAHLQDSNRHLRRAALNYRTAHDTVVAVLRRADAEYEFDKSISDAVQGILVAAALAVVLPEAMVTAAAMATARALVASSSTQLTRAGIVIASARASAPALGTAADAAAGEVAEIGAGAVVGAARTDTGRPSDSVGAAGPSTTDQFSMVLDHLNALIGAVPSLGGVASFQRDVGLHASQLATAAAKLRAGDPSPLSIAELETRMTALEQVDRAGADSVGSIRAIANRMLTLKNQALAVPVEEPTVIEDRLWTRWMSSLVSDFANEMLDNDVIEGYLGPNGKRMFDFGSYTFDSEQRAAVTSAQRRWLISEGVEPGSSVGLTLSRYKAQTRLHEIRRTVVGRTGRLIGPTALEIDGQRYEYARNAGTLPVGTQMTALHVIIKPRMQGDVLIDRWTNDLFDVYCNPVEPSGDRQPAAATAGTP